MVLYRRDSEGLLVGWAIVSCFAPGSWLLAPCFLRFASISSSVLTPAPIVIHKTRSSERNHTDIQRPKLAIPLASRCGPQMGRDCPHCHFLHRDLGSPHGCPHQVLESPLVALAGLCDRIGRTEMVSDLVGYVRNGSLPPLGRQGRTVCVSSVVFAFVKIHTRQKNEPRPEKKKQEK